MVVIFYQLQDKITQSSKNIISDRVTVDPFYPGKITKQTENKTDRKTKQQQKFKKIKNQNIKIKF